MMPHEDYSYISSRLISDAAEEGYHTLIMVGRHPIAILNIEISPSEVDVNVHPAKREIKLSHEAITYDAVKAAVQKALGNTELIREIGEVRPRQDVLIAKQEMAKAAPKKDAPGKYPILKNKQMMLKESEPVIKKRNLPELRLLGQVHKTYVIAEGDTCMYLIDQHAAQERVNYELFMESLKKAGSQTQRLLKPLVLELSPKQHTLVLANRDVFLRLGFAIDDFGTNSVVVSTYPIIMPNQDRQLVLDLIDELELAKNKISEEKERLLTLRACKASVKANQELTIGELGKIIDDLSYCESPYTFPHGRPILIRLTIDDLEKMFKRK